MDQQVINALKGLVIDGVDAAGSGHPGGAMSSMDLAYLLFTEYLRLDPQDPDWLGRDRFILSAGHESMLIYSLLFATGWLKLDDLKGFRQLHSRTPGHPENLLTPGIECTTGPLGQGAAMSVGFAAATLHLAEKFTPELFCHRTWALLGDGCMQEDITYGAASLAGHLGLGNLIWIYDKNRAQISGKIDRAFSDDEACVYKGLGWNVVTIDGHDHGAIRQAYDRATAQGDRPTLIIADTVMARGAASMEGSHKTHGAPLPAQERQLTKDRLELGDQPFHWREEYTGHFRRNFEQQGKTAQKWRRSLEKHQADSPVFASRWSAHFGRLDVENLPQLPWNHTKPLATRSAFGHALASWADAIPSLVGGSADLEPSNMTGAFAEAVGDFQKSNRGGRNLAFGVREFPMSAFCNGAALHGGLVPFDATFLTFSDYSRPAIRLGALQKARVIHEFTHDSFYLGEDGPTHQPVEHLMSLRLIPDLLVLRPADPLETEVLFKVALAHQGPSCICLSRQSVPFLENDRASVSAAARGAWFVRGNEEAWMVIYATGAEVGLALQVADQFTQHAVAVVSVPCWEQFFAQDRDYQESVMMRQCRRRVSIEAGSTLGWEKFIGDNGLAIGLDTFGASAPAADLAKEFGFTPESIAERIRAQPWF